MPTTPNPFSSQQAISQTPAQIQQQTQTAQQAQKAAAGNTPAQLTCNGVATCLVVITYTIGPGIAQYVAYVGAYFFSIVTNLSLNSTAYALGFLSDMWVVVRDFANMAFIFILIYISILVMLRAETGGTVKMLAAVIVVALLVNFSFFFTRVAIDAGNIVAVQIYNAIPYGTNPQTAVIAGTGIKDLSVSLMDSLKVQSLLSTETFKRTQTAMSGSGGASGEWGAAMVFIFIFLFAAAVFWILFFVFLQVGIKFLLRIVGLWIVLIASPAAFIAAAIPKAGQPFFKMWYERLFQYSIYPAVFLFMFLILNKFTETVITKSGTQSNLFSVILNPTVSGADVVPLGFLSAVSGVVIRLGFILALLYIGLKVADKVVQEGNAVAGKITGWTRGKVTGTAKWAGGTAFTYSAGNIAKRGIDKLIKNPPKSRLGQLVDYAWRKNVLAPIAGKSFGGASSYTDVTKRRDERKKDWESNIDAKKVRDAGDTLAAINPAWDKREQRIKELDEAKKTRALNAAEAGEYKQLEIDQGRVRVQRETAIKTIEHASGPQVATINGANIEQIVKQLSESQIKAIKESNKFSREAFEKIAQKWHSESPKAPIGESKKHLVELAKIRDILKDKKNFDTTRMLPVLERLAKPGLGNTVTVNLKEAEDGLKQVEAEKERVEDIREDRTKTNAERAEAGQQAKQLNKMQARLEKMIEAIKNVPAKAGNEEAPMAFKYTQTST